MQPKSAALGHRYAEGSRYVWTQAWLNQPCSVLNEIGSRGVIPPSASNTLAKGSVTPVAGDIPANARANAAWFEGGLKVSAQA